MDANSNVKPDQIVRTGERSYQVRWNIVRNDKKDENDNLIESWDFEYNSKCPAADMSAKEIVVAIVRERYDVNDELSLAMRRADDAVKLADHEAYVNFAKGIADQILLTNEAV